MLAYRHAPTDGARSARRRLRERRSILTLAAIIAACVGGRGWLVFGEAPAPHAADLLPPLPYGALHWRSGSEHAMRSLAVAPLARTGCDLAAGAARPAPIAPLRSPFDEGVVRGSDPWYLQAEPIVRMTPAWFLLRPQEAQSAGRRAGAGPACDESTAIQVARPRPRMARAERGAGVLSALAARTAAGQAAASEAWSRKTEAVPIPAEAPVLPSLMSVTAGIVLLSLLLLPLGFSIDSQARQQPRGPPCGRASEGGEERRSEIRASPTSLLSPAKKPQPA